MLKLNLLIINNIMTYLDVAEDCDSNRLEFALNYEDNKGYDKFTITEVFEG